MLPNNPTDSTPQAGAQVAQTDASQAAQGDSQGAATMPEWFKPFAEQIKNANAVAKSKQSEADKVRAALGKQVKKDYAKEIEPIVESARLTLGLDDAQVAAYRRDLLQAEVNRRVLSGDEQTPVETQPQGSGAVETATFGEAEVLAELKMSESDPEVMQAMAQAGGNPLKLAAGLATLKEKRAKAPQPTLSSAAAATGGTFVPESTVAQLTTQYTKDMLAARGNATLLKQIKAEAAKKGVPVDSIGFV
jgi:hypothetical protein